MSSKARATSIPTAPSMRLLLRLGELESDLDAQVAWVDARRGDESVVGDVDLDADRRPGDREPDRLRCAVRNDTVLAALDRGETRRLVLLVDPHRPDDDVDRRRRGGAVVAESADRDREDAALSRFEVRVA